MMRILLLGPAAVFENDIPVNIRRRVQRAMLFYLACRGDRVGRSELLDLFWAGEDEDVARRRLTETLSKLRADLPEPDLLVVNHSQVGLDFSRVSVDALEFQHLVDLAGTAPWKLPAADPLPEALYTVMQRAVRLWRSPGFMAGVNLPSSILLEDWLSYTGQHFEITRQRLLERLAAHEMASGNHEGALRYCRQALETDPLNDNLHYQVLTLLQLQKRATEAIAYANYLVDLYQREEIDPMPPRLLAACQELRGKVALIKPSPLPSFPPILNLDVPFTGREPERAALSRAYQTGGVALVTGTAGIGKSRLIQETLSALEPDPRVVFASAHPLETTLPYQALIHMLRQHVDLDTWRLLPPENVMALTALIPELLVTLNNASLNPAQIRESAPPAVQEAIWVVLDALNHSKPLVLVLENAQWVDRSTCQVLAYLLEQGVFDHNLLIIALRPDAPNPHIDQFISDVDRRAILARIELPALNVESTAKLTRYITGYSLEGPSASRLNDMTDGNPMVLIETIRFLVQFNHSMDFGELFAQIPEHVNIQDMARWVIEKLKPAELSMLYTACLIGNEFDPAVVETAAHLSPEQAAGALEELEKMRLVRTVGFAASQTPGYYYIHAYVSQAIIHHISPARQRLIHLRIAEATAQRLGFQSYGKAALIAEHYEAAGEKVEAFRWWLKAAGFARQLFSAAEAGHAVQRAQKLFATASHTLAEEDIDQFFTLRGEIGYETFDPAGVESNYTALLILSQQHSSPRLTGKALNGLACAAWMQKNPEKALGLVEQALPYLVETQSISELAGAYIVRGMIHTEQNQYQAAIESFQEVVDSARGRSDPLIIQIRFNARWHLCKVLFLTGHPRQAQQYGEEALNEAINALIPYNQMRAYTILSEVSVHNGDYTACADYAARGLEIAAKLQNPLITSQLHAELAHALIGMGQIDRAVEQIRAAQELAERHHYPDILAYLFQLRGDIDHLLLELDSAIHNFEQGQAAIGKPLHYHYFENRLRQGMVHGMRGEVEIARRLVADVLENASACNMEVEVIAATTASAMICFASGERQEARRLTAEAITKSRDSGYFSMTLMSEWFDISLELVEGKLLSAYTRARALTDNARLHQHAWMALSGLRLMQAALSAGLDAAPVQAEIDAQLAKLAAGITLEPYCSQFERNRQRVSINH